MNVNLDVLELILARLDGSDLVAAALVSRAFLAGAIPALYARIEYTFCHAKRAQHVMSPFATLAAHDHLAVHVKRVAIHTAPVFPSPSHQVCPAFLKDLVQALCISTNLRSFACSVNLLPPLLPQLVDKPRLRHLRIRASLGSRQTAILQSCTGLHSLSLDFPAWNVIDALPKWTAGMQNSLTHLTLFMSQDLDGTVLNTTLAQLPRLRGLHVIGCPRITHIIVLKALFHTPVLRELSFSIFPSQESALPHLNFPIPPLTHLSIDIRASYPDLKSHLARIIARLSPRDALAICGGWIGEITSSSELSDARRDTSGRNSPDNAGGGGGGGLTGQNPPDHVHGNDQANDPPLLSPPTNVFHGTAYPNQNPGSPNPGNPIFFGFSFPFPPENPNGSNNDPPGPGPANPANPGYNPGPDLSLVSSFPPTLSILHLPQLSPAALREVMEHCEGLQVLGIVIGNAFASPGSGKARRTTGRHTGHVAKSGVRPEVCVLSDILTRARALRKLIIDAGGTDAPGNGTGAGTDGRAGGSYRTSSNGSALLTPLAVRMLMRESPYLRRIVGEGRVWESTSPTPSLPTLLPHCVTIELTLSKAHYGPGTGNNHSHGSASLGSHGYGQMEAGNEHWFWLTGSASGDQVQGGFQVWAKELFSHKV